MNFEIELLGIVTGIVFVTYLVFVGFRFVNTIRDTGRERIVTICAQGKDTCATEIQNLDDRDKRRIAILSYEKKTGKKLIYVTEVTP